MNKKTRSGRAQTFAKQLVCPHMSFPVNCVVCVHVGKAGVPLISLPLMGFVVNFVNVNITVKVNLYQYSLYINATQPMISKSVKFKAPAECTAQTLRFHQNSEMHS